MQHAYINQAVEIRDKLKEIQNRILVSGYAIVKQDLTDFKDQLRVYNLEMHSHTSLQQKEQEAIKEHGPQKGHAYYYLADLDKTRAAVLSEARQAMHDTCAQLETKLPPEHVKDFAGILLNIACYSPQTEPVAREFCAQCGNKQDARLPEIVRKFPDIVVRKGNWVLQPLEG